MRTAQNVYREQVCLNGMTGSEKGESRYKTMNGKTVLQLPEQRNKRKSFKSIWPKIELRVFGSGINRETVRKIILEDLKK
jgi:hypothetical protein